MLFLNKIEIGLIEIKKEKIISFINTLSVKLSKPIALITSSKEFIVPLFGISDDEFVKRYL